MVGAQHQHTKKKEEKETDEPLFPASSPRNVQKPFFALKTGQNSTVLPIFIILHQREATRRRKGGGGREGGPGAVSLKFLPACRGSRWKGESDVFCSRCVPNRTRRGGEEGGKGGGVVAMNFSHFNRQGGRFLGKGVGEGERRVSREASLTASLVR